MPLYFTFESQEPFVVNVSGQLDEFTAFEQFPNSPDKVTMDVSCITRLNSMGIRLWIPFINQYSKEKSVTLKGLPYSMCVQANMISNFLGLSKVATCYAPYNCEKCGEDKLLELQSTEIRNADYKAPNLVCTKCKEYLKFDELDHYFNFIK